MRLGKDRRIAARWIAALLGVTLLAGIPPRALAGVSLISPLPAIEGLGFCTVEANGAPGELRSESAVNLHGGLPDDGTVKNWTYIGTAGGSGKIVLDLFGRGVATHPVIESQYPSPYESEDQTVEVTDTIPVLSGEQFGVTVSAGEDSETQANVAAVQCTSGSSSGSDLAIWEAPMTIGQKLIWNKEGPGELDIYGRRIEYDAPVVESVSPESGPAAGGTEVTIKGKHLANAGVFFPEGATIVPAATPEAEDDEVKVITPEAVTGAPAGGTLETIATGKSTKFNFAYVGTPRSRTPQITLGEPTNITQTTAQLNATVNIEGLVASEPGDACFFGYSDGEIGEEEEKTEGCEPLPEAGSETPQSVSTQLNGLSPGTTYHYYLNVRTKYAERSGFNETNDEASFKTLGTGETGKEVKKEAIKESPKELLAIVPVGVPAPTPAPPKGLAAISPIVGLLGSSSLTPTPAGALPVTISCPAGESGCIGSITIKTAGAVSAGVAVAAKKAVLTLASGSFKLAGGRTVTVTLHLSAKARALLARAHTVHARITIIAHDSTGATHTTVKAITLHAAKPKR
jgi:hypothetical protein